MNKKWIKFYVIYWYLPGLAPVHKHHKRLVKHDELTLWNVPQHTLERVHPSSLKWPIGQWEKDRNTNRKLGFYNSIKKNFSCEDYLWIKLTYQQSKKLAQQGTSSHWLKIETEAMVLFVKVTFWTVYASIAAMRTRSKTPVLRPNPGRRSPRASTALSIMI